MLKKHGKYLKNLKICENIVNIYKEWKTMEKLKILEIIENIGTYWKIMENHVSSRPCWRGATASSPVNASQGKLQWRCGPRQYRVGR